MHSIARELWWDMSDYPIMRLVAKWPKLAQAIGLIGLAVVALCWLAPAGQTGLYAAAALVCVIAAVFMLCFVELVTLMAKTLLPR